MSPALKELSSALHGNIYMRACLANAAMDAVFQNQNQKEKAV